jgi:hypothetical protein
MQNIAQAELSLPTGYKMTFKGTLYVLKLFPLRIVRTDAHFNRQNIGNKLLKIEVRYGCSPVEILWFLVNVLSDRVL